jgi:hypothetical protein
MRSPQPPALAQWLLKHFGCSTNNEAVIGDLNERDRHGRSGTWYWTQTIKAMMAGFIQEVGGHKLLAAGAVLRGWALLLACGLLFRSLVAGLNGVLRNQPGIGGMLTTYRGVLLMMLIAVSGAAWAGIGWVLRRLYQPHEKAMVLAFVATVFVAVVLVAIVMSTQAPAFSPAASNTHPLLIGLSGSMTGLLCLMTGAGLLKRVR